MVLAPTRVIGATTATARSAPTRTAAAPTRRLIPLRRASASGPLPPPLAPLAWRVCGTREQPRRCWRAAAASRSQPPNREEEPSWAERALGLLNVGATLGSVGGAVAVLVTEQMLFLYFPVVLPVIGLLAAAQRERLRGQASQRMAREQLDSLLHALEGTSGTMELSPAALESLSALAEAVEAQAEASGEQGDELVEKLAAIEAALQKMGRASRDAARQSMDTARQVEKLAPLVADEVLAALEERSSRNVAQFDSRLESLETGLSGLELSQEESLRRLARSIADGMENVESSVLQALQSDTSRQQLQLPSGQYLPTTALQPSPGAVGSLSAQLMLPAESTGVELTPSERERLRVLVEEEVQAGVDRVLERQARRSARLAEARLDEEQWDALQAQLRRIQGTLVALAEEQPNIIE
eukprot:jgi/Tetstr1/444216/TSEL_032109.t1